MDYARETSHYAFVKWIYTAQGFNLQLQIKISLVLLQKEAMACALRIRKIEYSYQRQRCNIYDDSLIISSFEMTKRYNLALFGALSWIFAEDLLEWHIEIANVRSLVRILFS